MKKLLVTFTQYYTVILKKCYIPPNNYKIVSITLFTVNTKILNIIIFLIIKSFML